MLRAIFDVCLNMLTNVLGESLFLGMWIGLSDITKHHIIARRFQNLTDWLFSSFWFLNKFPKWKHLDLRLFFTAWLIAILRLILLGKLSYVGSQIFSHLYIGVILVMITWMLHVMFLVTIAYVLVSWIDPFSSFIELLNNLLHPFFVPIRKFFPQIPGIDLSPFIVMTCIRILQIVLVRLWPFLCL